MVAVCYPVMERVHTPLKSSQNAIEIRTHNTPTYVPYLAMKRTHTLTHVKTHAHTHAHTHARTHALTHIKTHVHMRTLAHTHTHTCTLVQT